MGRFLDSREDLQNVLEELLGSRNVYFQPPESIQMQYPCIVYKLDAINVMHADSVHYRFDPRYQLTLIDRNPDSEFVDKLMALRYCTFERYYSADNLNHFVFAIYF